MALRGSTARRHLPISGDAREEPARLPPRVGVRHRGDPSALRVQVRYAT